MKKRSTEKASKPEKVLAKEKARMTVQISQNTIERLKDAVYWERFTVAQFVEDALEAALQKIEKRRGKSYPKRKSELKPGRPLR